MPFSQCWTLRVTAARRSAARRCSSLRAWRVARAATEMYLLNLPHVCTGVQCVRVCVCLGFGSGGWRESEREEQSASQRAGNGGRG